MSAIILLLATASSAAAKDLPGLEEVHPAERDAVRVLCQKTRYGELEEGRVVWLAFRDQPLTTNEVKLLAQLPKLKTLWVGDQVITDEPAQHLEALDQLEILGLNDSRITDDALATVSKLKNLRELYLGNTKITDEGVALLAELARLEALYVFDCPVTGRGLAKFKNLRRLGISDTKLNDDGLAAAAGNRHLVDLNLGSTMISDDGLAHLAHLQELEELNLIGTRITDAGLVHLHGLKNLQHICLSVEGDLTVEGVHRLERAIKGLARYRPPVEGEMRVVGNQFVNPFALAVTQSSTSGARVFRQPSKEPKKEKMKRDDRAQLMREFNMAAALQNHALYEKAAESWKELLKKMDDEDLVPAALLYLATCEAQLGRHKDSIETALKLSAGYPGSPHRGDAELLVAANLMTLGKKDTAERWLQKIEREHPKLKDRVGAVREGNVKSRREHRPPVSTEAASSDP